MKRPGTPTYPKTVGPWELEPHYSRHVSAMTTEGLHHKQDIAFQLALRDKRIAELEEQSARQTPFALDWRDALEGIARELGLPTAISLAADVWPAVAKRIAELEEALAKADEELERYHPDRSGARR